MNESPPAGPSPAPKGTVTQRAIERIKAMIGEGLLEPGQRLPTERDLGVQLGISRSSVREAVRALTVMGVLEARHGSGIYVTQLQAGDLLETFGVVADLSRGPRLLELLEVRRVLESTAAALAAARITPERLEAVEGHLAAMNATDDPDEILAHDLAFHREIAAAARQRDDGGDPGGPVLPHLPHPRLAGLPGGGCLRPHPPGTRRDPPRPGRPRPRGGTGGCRRARGRGRAVAPGPGRAVRTSRRGAAREAQFSVRTRG